MRCQSVLVNFDHIVVAEACCSNSSKLGCHCQNVHLRALVLPLAFLFFMHLQHQLIIIMAQGAYGLHLHKAS